MLVAQKGKNVADREEARCGKRVLVIDDDRVFRLLMEKYLAGYELQLEVDGLDGFRSAQTTLPDLVISDFMMPKMDGLRLCRLLKMDPRTRDIPVILLSAVDEDEYREKGQSSGAAAVLPKSISGQQLRDVVEEVLGGS